MIDRSFSETDLRDMLERAHAFQPDVATGRFIVQTSHESRSWEVVVEPDAAAQLLVVVTAYPLG
jgi:hypothetical protein